MLMLNNPLTAASQILDKIVEFLFVNLLLNLSSSLAGVEPSYHCE